MVRPPEIRRECDSQRMSYRAILSRLSRNTLSVYTAFFVRKAAVLALGVAIARVGGAAEFGLYCIALLLLEFGIQVAVFGTDILVIREVSSASPVADAFIRNALGWRLAVTVAIYPLLIAAAFWLSAGAGFCIAVAMMGLGMVADTLGDLYLSVVQGRERVDLCALAEGATSLAGLVLGLGAVLGGYGLQGLALAYALRGVANLLLGLLLYYRLHPGRSIIMRWQTDVMRDMLGKGAPIAASRLLTIVYLGSGLFVLKYYYGEQIVGQFAGSMNIFNACTAVGMLTMVAAFPTISRLQATAPGDLRRTTTDLLRFFCWAGLPASTVVALLSARILMVFGSEFADCHLALVLLMVAVPFSLVYGLIERLAYAAHDQKRVWSVRWLSITLNLAVLIALVGRIGYLAPPVAIICAEVAMLALFAHRLYVYVPGMRWMPAVGPPLIALVLALAATLLLRTWVHPYESLLFLLVFGAIGGWWLVKAKRRGTDGTVVGTNAQ